MKCLGFQSSKKDLALKLYSKSAHHPKSYRSRAADGALFINALAPAIILSVNVL